MTCKMVWQAMEKAANCHEPVQIADDAPWPVMKPASRAMATPQAGPDDGAAKKPTAADRALARQLRNYASGELPLCCMTRVTAHPSDLSLPRPVRCEQALVTSSG